MLSPKDTVYPRLKKNISRKEINKLYTPAVDEIAIAQKRKLGGPKLTIRKLCPPLFSGYDENLSNDWVILKC